MIPGSLMGLMINGAFISCEVSCQINLNQTMLESSAIDSGGWQEFIAGIRGWTISVNGNLLLESVPSDIKGMITTGYINQLPMFASFSTMVSSDIQMSMSGAVLFNTASIAAASQGVANWQCQLQGTGKLTTSYQDYQLLIDSMPAEENYPILVDQGFYTT